MGKYSFLIQWDKGSAIFDFYVYRPAENWILRGFFYEGDLDAAFAKIALESGQPSASPQMVRARNTNSPLR
jgi:hypothetical protein